MSLSMPPLHVVVKFHWYPVNWPLQDLLHARLTPGVVDSDGDEYIRRRKYTRHWEFIWSNGTREYSKLGTTKSEGYWWKNFDNIKVQRSALGNSCMCISGIKDSFKDHMYNSQYTSRRLKKFQRDREDNKASHRRVEWVNSGESSNTEILPSLSRAYETRSHTGCVISREVLVFPTEPQVPKYNKIA